MVYNCLILILGGVRVKRAFAALLALVMLCLCSCQQQPDPDTPAAAEMSQTSAPDDALPDPPIDSTPDEPPSESPSESPAIDQTLIINYTYTAAKREDLRFSYKHPTHWLDASTDLSAVFEEPVEPGTTPARMAITRKDAGQIVVTELVGVDKLNAFSDRLKENSTNYKMKRGKRFKFSGLIGFQFVYTGEFNGVPLKGHAAMAFSTKKNAFYLFHFRAPQDRYTSFDNVRKTLLKSIKL